MGLIGFLDDYLKIVRGQSQGLVARWKLVGQISFGVGLGAYLLLFPLTTSAPPSATQLPFFKYIVLALPWPLYLAFVTFVTTASSNAVNLTDGLDGLAAGLTVIAAGAFAIFCYLFGRVDAARYLGVLHLPGPAS
jgi:phospho-N-acetylmuramoyl-pentapeptide-transferase